MRRSGQSTFRRHLFPVAMIAYKEALRFLGPIEAKKAAIYGFLHDTIEDAEDNGLTHTGTKQLILQIFGAEVYGQVLLLTVIPRPNLNDVEEDEFATRAWIEKIQRMNPETKIVKLSDIYMNTDGDEQTQRETKLTQRAYLIQWLGSAAPELASRTQYIDTSPQLN